MAHPPKDNDVLLRCFQVWPVYNNLKFNNEVAGGCVVCSFYPKDGRSQVGTKDRGMLGLVSGFTTLRGSIGLSRLLRALALATAGISGGSNNGARRCIVPSTSGGTR